MMKCHITLQFIVVFTVCQSTHLGVTNVARKQRSEVSIMAACKPNPCRSVPGRYSLFANLSLYVVTIRLRRFLYDVNMCMG